MNLKNYAFPLLFTGVPLVLAQTAPPSSDSGVNPEPSEEETLVLSPFTVNTERDTGYQATNTLAGTRLSTPLKDLGASISVFTKDFLNDIGASNASELLIYATGMEAGGSQGNYSGTGSSIGETQVVGDGPRTDSTGSSRSRGLGAAQNSRGYFNTSVGFDSYNTSAVTVARGPNAILFGAGSPAGVVDSTPSPASVTRNSNQVEFRLGDNSAVRSTLNVNRVLIDRQLGIRFAALDDQERFDQRPAFEDRRRLYGAVQYEPFRSTRVRAYIEHGETNANRPITVLPFDSFRTWRENGRPTYDWTFYDDPARNPNAAAQNANNNRGIWLSQAQIFNVIAIPFPLGSSVPQTSFRTLTPVGNGVNQLRATVFHPTLNRDSANDAIQFNETLNIGEAALVDAAFPGGVRPPGLRQQGFTDSAFFDWKNQMIDETSIQQNAFRQWNVAIEQGFWQDDRGADRIGVELSYFNERSREFFKNSYFSQANGNHIRVDPNVTLPDGRPNPNFGRAYVLGGNNADTRRWLDQRDVYRGTAFVRYDLKDLFPEAGKWLGRHTVTALGEQSRLDRLRYGTRLFTTGPAAEATSATPDNFNRRANFMVYISDPMLNGDVRLQPIRNVDLEPGLTSNTSWFVNASTDPTVQGNVGLAQTGLVEIATGGGTGVRRSLLESQAFVLQSYTLQEHLVTIVGWRRDEEYVTPAFPTFNFANYQTKNRFTFDDFDFPSRPPRASSGENLSYSAVLRWPRKIIPLPSGTDVSLTYNKSGNYNPAGARQGLYGEELPNPDGDTEEYGIAVSLFDDKLSLRANKFKTSISNASFGGANTGLIATLWNNALRQTLTGWVTDITNGIDRRPAIDEILNASPRFRDALNLTITPGPNNTLLVTNNTLSPTETNDFVAEGYEFELVYNPTRNWRIAANVAQQETTLSSLAPQSRELIETLLPVWEKYRSVPRGNYPPGWRPGDPLVNVETYGAWLDTNIIVPYRTLIAQEGQVSGEQRKWRANLVTNYTFRTSFLKGFNVGTGIRWQDKYALGYPVSRDASGAINVDIRNPYMGDADTNVDVWIGYTRKLFDGRVNWKAQLNVKNIIGDDSLIPINVQPDGSVATMRIPPEKRVYLTNTFEF